MGFVDTAKKAFALALPLIIFLVFGEIVVRVYTHFVIVYDVEMSRYALTLKMPSQNPLIGHVHIPNSRARLMGVMKEINSDGLRDEEYPVQRNDSYRMIFLGDSLTFGWGVEKEDAFEAIIERELNRHQPTEILNFAAGNYNTEQQVNLFLEKGLKYRPDRVVVFYFINDAEETPVRSNWGFLAHSRFVTFVWSRVQAALVNLSAGKTFREFYAKLYAPGQPGWINAQNAFLTLAEVCREQGIDLRVVLLPELHGLTPYLLASEHRKVTQFLDENGIENLDLAPYFEGETEPMRLWVARDDAHPNRIAHKLIARHAADFVSP